MNINDIRGILYKAAKYLGDLNAIRRGPKAIGKRIIRRQVGKQTQKGMNRFFK